MGTTHRLLLLITAGTLTLLAAHIQQVESSGTFQLRLSTFTNPEGRDSTGGCCSGQQKGDGSCQGTCNVFFHICLQHYQKNVDPKHPCTYGEFYTPVLGNSSVLRFHDLDPTTNQVNINLNFSWPGEFSLIIEAFHSFGSIGGNSMLISRFIAQRSLEAKSEWTEDNLSSSFSTLDVYYRIQCETFYFGEHCDRLCRPRDDKFGHYTCRTNGEKVCLPGWKEEYCDVAVCLLGCHKIHGQCDQPRECKCRLGWEGPLCDKCTRYPGCVHGTCLEPWECLCNEGWGGLFCDQDLNYCTNHKPCINGGTCTNTGHGSYTCTCSEEYMGKNCDMLRNPCIENPCHNGGTCKNIAEGKYNCQCTPGFFGPRCETSANICTDNPCVNGGTCVHDPGGFICACPLGFSGTRCENLISSCEFNFCRNGGTCIDLLEGPQCHCSHGFSGAHCEIVEDCSHQPCINGGSCIKHLGLQQCICAPGYAGSLCQINVDECQVKPCANGGTCHDRVNNYLCDCKPGFTGKNCSAHAGECSSSPCKHGAPCENVPNGFMCHCPTGYHGAFCEFFLLQSETHLHKELPEHQGSAVLQNAISNVSHQVSEDQEQLSGSQVALIATVSTLVPILVLVVAAIILMTRRCHYLYKDNMPKDLEQKEEDEELQNERNSMHMNNKCMQHNMIVNTLDRMPAKVTNEGPGKVLNIEKSCSKLPDSKNLCVQRTLDRKDHNGVCLDEDYESPSDWSPNNGVYIIEDHFQPLPFQDVEADVLATEV